MEPNGATCSARWCNMSTTRTVPFHDGVAAPQPAPCRPGMHSSVDVWSSTCTVCVSANQITYLKTQSKSQFAIGRGLSAKVQILSSVVGSSW